jgi:hypothetical protein
VAFIRAVGRRLEDVAAALWTAGMGSCGVGPLSSHFRKNGKQDKRKGMNEKPDSTESILAELAESTDTGVREREKREEQEISYSRLESPDIYVL